MTAEMAATKAIRVALRTGRPNPLGQRPYLEVPIDAAPNEVRAELHVVKHKDVGAQVDVEIFDLDAPILVEGPYSNPAPAVHPSRTSLRPPSTFPDPGIVIASVARIPPKAPPPVR